MGASRFPPSVVSDPLCNWSCFPNKTACPPPPSLWRQALSCLSRCLKLYPAFTAALQLHADIVVACGYLSACVQSLLVRSSQGWMSIALLPRHCPVAVPDKNHNLPILHSSQCSAGALCQDAARVRRVDAHAHAGRVCLSLIAKGAFLHAEVVIETVLAKCPACADKAWTMAVLGA